jgi:hypothetical protein
MADAASGAAMSAASVPMLAPVRSRSSAAASSSGSRRRPVMMTRWASASRLAIAKPMPVAPPPTSAIRSVMAASQGLVRDASWA